MGFVKLGIFAGGNESEMDEGAQVSTEHGGRKAC